MEQSGNLIWRTSTRSSGECVELASNGEVLVRDSKDRGGVTLAFTADAWEMFTGDLK